MRSGITSLLSAVALHCWKSPFSFGVGWITIDCRAPNLTVMFIPTQSTPQNKWLNFCVVPNAEDILGGACIYVECVPLLPTLQRSITGTTSCFFIWLEIKIHWTEEHLLLTEILPEVIIFRNTQLSLSLFSLFQWIFLQSFPLSQDCSLTLLCCG